MYAISIASILMLQLLYSVPVLSIPNAVYVCSYDDYGSPDAKHCNELIEGSQKRGRFPGIAHLDPWNHAFLIEGFAREDEFTPSQWARRIYLPYLINNPHIRHCRIALFARGFEHDTAYWSTIAADARKIMGKCLDIPGVLSTGGGIYTGTLQGIEMTIYAPGSVFDRATNYPEFVDGRFNITSRTNSTKMSSLIANLNADDAANLTSVA